MASSGQWRSSGAKRRAGRLKARLVARHQRDALLAADVDSLLAAEPDWRIPYNDGRFVVACRRDSTALADAARAGALAC